MHDWMLMKIEFDWQAARVTVFLEDSTCTGRSLIAEGVHDMHIPRKNEWGPSVNVNEVHEIESMSSGLHRLKIEMQSGDVIQIVAQRFGLPAL
jgi:hypothetical protein